MVLLLILVLLLLMAAVVYLHLEFHREQKVFKKRLEALEQIIGESLKKQGGQLDRIKLSEELNASLKQHNAALSHDLFGLHYELFDMLSKNNLLKK